MLFSDSLFEYCIYTVYNCVYIYIRVTPLSENQQLYKIITQSHHTCHESPEWHDRPPPTSRCSHSSPGAVWEPRMTPLGKSHRRSQEPWHLNERSGRERGSKGDFHSSTGSWPATQWKNRKPRQKGKQNHKVEHEQQHDI